MADMTGLVDEIRRFGDRAAKDALDRVVQDTIRAAPHASGYLETTIHGEGPEEVAPFVWRAEIVADADYAAFSDAGTQPHVIRARGKVLAFYWPKVGKDVFFRFVNHPGNAAGRWFNGGQDDGEPMRGRWDDATSSAAAAA